MTQPPPIASSQDAAPGGADPLVEALRAAAVERHRLLLETVLQTLEQPRSGSDGGDPSGLRTGLAGRLRPDRAKLQRRYLREIGRRFEPLAPPQPQGGGAERELLRYTRPPGEVLEEQMVLDALRHRLQAALEPRLDPLEQRLRVLVRRGALPIATTAYSPATALESLRMALEALDIELPQRRMLFALYEPAALLALAEVYEHALGVLERPSAGPLASTAAGPAPAQAALTVDDATLQALRREAAGDAHRAEARLAASLLSLIGSTPPPAVETHPLVQRIALLGPLCAAWFEPLTPAVRADVEPLRFALIKIALADSSFLLSAGHPLRALLGDACEHQDEHRRRQACSRVEQMAMSAEFVVDGLPQLASLTAQQIDSCLDQLHQRDGKREEARLGEARRNVAQALEHATLPHARPQGLRLFLRAGWGPLLTQRLLKHGRPSAPWQDALDQLDRLLDAISGESTRVREFEQLLAGIAAALFEAGMRSERCERLQQALREAYYELRVDAAADTAPPAIAGQVSLPGDGVLDLPEIVGDEAAPASATGQQKPGGELDLELLPFHLPAG